MMHGQKNIKLPSRQVCSTYTIQGTKQKSHIISWTTQTTSHTKAEQNKQPERKTVTNQSQRM